MKSLPAGSARLLLRLWRAAALAALGFFVWWQARTLESRRSVPAVTAAEARLIFPEAAALSPATRDGTHAIYDASGAPLGSVMRTSPDADDIVGYSGPNDVLIGLNPAGAVAGALLLHSGDTVDHAAMVERDASYWTQFRGWKPGEPFPRIAAVSGATLTSGAIAEAVQKRLAGGAPSLRFPREVTLEEVRALFPEALSMAGDSGRLRVEGPGASLLGYAVRTSPAAESVSGYRGPTESLVALEPDGKTIRGVRLRESYDTESYVTQVREDEWYLAGFKGRTASQVAAMDFQKEGIEGVSGATLTSWAVAEGMKRRFAATAAPLPERTWRPALRDWLALGVVCGAVLLAFSRWRGVRWVRIAWQALLMIWALWSGGDLLSLALLSGWAQHGVTWAAAPGAALIAGVALFIPWAARRQIYCHQICPHGAAQQWAGKLRRRKAVVPPKWDRALRAIPWLLLAALPVMLLWRLDPARLEPFDAWVWRAAAWIPLAIAVVGLVASAFIPQAYCRYGCPTGALLSFLRTTGAGDRFGRRDWAFVLLLGISGASAAAAQWIPGNGESSAQTLQGKAMGTTWEVTWRGNGIADPAAMQQQIATLLGDMENELSGWRPQSALSVFNASRSAAPQPVPPRIATLAALAAEMSRATGGAFDVTAAPLVKLWGFGPPPRRADAPTGDEIAASLRHTGAAKLRIAADTLQKADPMTEIDLNALAEGHAGGEIAALLEQRGVSEYLINVGGELRARGAWPVAVEHPLRTLTLRDAALATSGTYRQNRAAGVQRATHLIDARTGRPVEHATVSVSVLHKDGALADGWATALNILGREAGMPLAQSLGLAAEFVEERDGSTTISATDAWKQR